VDVEVAVVFVVMDVELVVVDFDIAVVVDFEVLLSHFCLIF